MQIYNTTRDRVLARSAVIADTPFARMKGLLGRDSLPEGEGMVIDPCNQIHTFFMRFPIDVLFVDNEGRIVRQLEALKPWRMSGMYFRARKVVELPAGVVSATMTREGDLLSLR